MQPSVAPAKRSGPISGSWAGTAGSSALALQLSDPSSGRVTGSASLTVSGAPRTTELTGTFVAKTGVISLREPSGSLMFTGTIDGTIARGTWSTGDGTTERQWFVVRKD